MSRKELLDARKALRSVREGASGRKGKKQRGEWELVSSQDYAVRCLVTKQVVGSVSRWKTRLTLQVSLGGRAVVEMRHANTQEATLCPSWTTLYT